MEVARAGEEETADEEKDDCSERFEPGVGLGAGLAGGAEGEEDGVACAVLAVRTYGIGYGYS